MKSAIVTLIREGEVSPMMINTYEETVRGILSIQYTPHHVVFQIQSGSIFDKDVIAYKADRIHEFFTYEEEE